MSTGAPSTVLPLVDAADAAHWIGGERRPPHSGEAFASINPATGEQIGAVARGDAEDVEAAYRAAEAAGPAWAARPVAERSELLRAFADRIAEHGEELARIDVADNGSPVSEMANDVAIAVAIIRYFAGAALQVRGETIPTLGDRLTFTTHVPYGVVGRIVPFNHPFMFAATKVAAPLLMGNTVVLKPSEHTSLSALRLAELTADILPPGVVNVVTGFGPEAGEALVRHPGVRRLAFIGSAATGRRIQAAAAETGVKTVTLELGGKNPIVVLPSADLDQAVQGAVRGMNFTWQGQSCGSTSRLIVHAEVRDSFVERVAEEVASLRAGPPDDPATQTGAIVSEVQFTKVMGYLDIGRDEGAQALVGGERATTPPLDRGWFVEPTVFDHVTPAMRLANEEVFGPILSVITVADADEALRVANAVPYGLTASVYSQDLRTAHRFAAALDAGYVWVNETSRHFLGVPYGGTKDSGIGREESFEELLSYTQVKAVNLNYSDPAEG